MHIQQTMALSLVGAHGTALVRLVTEPARTSSHTLFAETSAWSALAQASVVHSALISAITLVDWRKFSTGAALQQLSGQDAPQDVPHQPQLADARVCLHVLLNETH